MMVKLSITTPSCAGGEVVNASSGVSDRILFVDKSGIDRVVGATGAGGVSLFEVDSPAVEAGIEAGDIILEIDQTPIKDMASFKRKLQEFKEGGTALLLIDRDGSTLFVTPRIRN